MKNLKNIFAKIALYFLCLACGLGTLWIMGGALGSAKAIYEPLTPSAQALYDKSVATMQAAESGLVTAKLLDHANGALPLSPEEVKTLEIKKQAAALPSGGVAASAVAFQ